MIDWGLRPPFFLRDPFGADLPGPILDRPGSSRVGRGPSRPQALEAARPQQNIYKCQEAASSAGRKTGPP